MTFNDAITTTIDFVRVHEAWAIPIVFILAFGESLAFLSLLLPATVILLGLGALIGESGIPFWPIWAAAAAGAFFGDWVSYWVGIHYKDRVATLWPLSEIPSYWFEAMLSSSVGGSLGPFLAVSSARCVLSSL